MEHVSFKSPNFAVLVKSLLYVFLAADRRIQTAILPLSLCWGISGIAAGGVL